MSQRRMQHLGYRNTHSTQCGDSSSSPTPTITLPPFVRFPVKLSIRLAAYRA